MSNRFWQLNAHPEGVDFAAALSLEHQDCPEPKDGEVLIRNQLLSMDAGTRMWMSDRTDGYQLPLPLGSAMVGLVLGRVVESRHDGFAKGELVRAFGNWADYSLVTPELADLRKMDPEVADLRQHFGVLGMNGWTALWGIMETGQAKAGETVLVSAAAGSTGILACQIARITGCKVFGIAGGAAKCRYLTETLGVDGAFDYKSPGLADALAGLGGIDVYFDNVGGPILDSVLPNMAMHGRIPICGTLASYGAKTPLSGPAHFDQILMKRLRVEGFFSPDFLDQGNRLTAQLKDWLDDGRLMLPFDETLGIENVLTAYTKLFTGGNIGKVIVRLDAGDQEEANA